MNNLNLASFQHFPTRALAADLIHRERLDKSNFRPKQTWPVSPATAALLANRHSELLHSAAVPQARVSDNFLLAVRGRHGWDCTCAGGSGSVLSSAHYRKPPGGTRQRQDSTQYLVFTPRSVTPTNQHVYCCSMLS